MAFSEESPPPRRSLAYRAAAMFVACGVAAYLFAPQEPTRGPLPHASLLPPGVAATVDAARPSEQVQRMLAEGGCPGWIVLAGDTALQQEIDRRASGGVYAGELRETAAHEAAAHESPPRVQYPVPVRVASAGDGGALFGAPPARLATAPTSSSAGQLVALPPVDGDELIPESEDSLRTSPEIARPPAASGGAAADAPAAGAGPADGREDASVESPPAALPEVEGSSGASAADAGDADDLLGPSEDFRPPGSGAASSSPGGATESLPPPSTSADELLDDRADLLEPPPQGPPAVPPTPPPTIPPLVRPPAAPLAGAGAPTAGGSSATSTAAKAPADAKSRCEFVAKNLYPSASECRTCHEKIYDQWSISSHAYAFVSPMFHKFEQKINDVASGTIGYFCYRCHTPAGTSLGISRAAPIWDLPLVAREGVTCVACHRINERYGKTNGERRIEPGPIFAPVYGGFDGDGVASVAANKSQYKVHTAPGEPGPGADMHAAACEFDQLRRSEFCTSCHQVAVFPGIKLEVVWDQYRASPACKKGIQCQDCHMGRIPGVASGYEFGPAALINDKSVHPHRKHSNHVFYGPGFSIAHPGVFPFNPKAERWTVQQWLQFDWRAGWGTDEFEDAVDDGKIRVAFPPAWKESDDRCDAREIIEDNLKKRELKNRLRAQVMENGSHVDGPFFDAPPRAGQELRFSYVVINTNEGHNLPTASLGAQPQLWANVVLIGPRGQRLWESGYLDSHGDLADIHSVDVREKRLEFDWQLFNLQTMFLITGAKGTDREFYLPVNIDIDPLPFIRPQAQPVALLNHPPFIRMEARSLSPLGSRRVPYKVPAQVLCEPGRYRLSFRMRSRTEPLYFMRFCEATTEMQRAMLEGTLDFHESSVEFEVR
jgi:hypothetical protein